MRQDERLLGICICLHVCGERRGWAAGRRRRTMAVAGLEVRAATVRAGERAARVRAWPAPLSASAAAVAAGTARLRSASAAAALRAAPAAAARQVLAGPAQGADRGPRFRRVDHRHRGGELRWIALFPGQRDDDRSDHEWFAKCFGECFGDCHRSTQPTCHSICGGHAEGTPQADADNPGQLTCAGETRASADDAGGGSPAS
jgi:hypothetical protein